MPRFDPRRQPHLARMAEDMRVRNLAPATIDAYTWHAAKFCEHFGQPPEALGPEQIHEWQVHLVDVKKVSWSSFNQAVCGLRFLYEVTLRKDWAVRHIPFGKRPKRLPVVLADDQVSDLLQCTENLKHRMVLLCCYAAGLRLAEATHLRVADIDGRRSQIRVCRGKGNKERRVPASPRLLDELRAYWRIHRPDNYLFPGRTADDPLSSATIQKACRLSAALAGIAERTTPHTLRHSYATGMLEAGVDLLTISRLLGHSSFATTMVYLHVRRQHLDRAPSPIDWLPVRQCPKWAEPATTDATSAATARTDESRTNMSELRPSEPRTGEPRTGGPLTSEPPTRRSSGRRPRGPRRRPRV